MNNQMKFRTTKTSDGTSYHGSVIWASVSELKAVLGTPDSADNDGRDKINFDWTCQNATGDVFTVYDWKYYRPLDENETICFHVGGHSKSSTDRAATEVQEELNSLRETASRVSDIG